MKNGLSKENRLSSFTGFYTGLLLMRRSFEKLSGIQTLKTHRILTGFVWYGKIYRQPKVLEVQKELARPVHCDLELDIFVFGGKTG